MQSRVTGRPLSILGGALCLDFVNTIDPRLEPPQEEFLPDFDTPAGGSSGSSAAASSPPQAASTDGGTANAYALVSAPGQRGYGAGIRAVRPASRCARELCTRR